MIVAFVGWDNNFTRSLCAKITSMGKHILSRSFSMVSHIKNPSKLHKNGKPENKNTV